MKSGNPRMHQSWPSNQLSNLSAYAINGISDASTSPASTIPPYELGELEMDVRQGEMENPVLSGVFRGPYKI